MKVGAGTAAIMGIESLVIMLACVYLIGDAHDQIKNKPTHASHTGGIATFVFAVLWLVWRIYLSWYTIMPLIFN